MPTSATVNTTPGATNKGASTNPDVGTADPIVAVGAAVGGVLLLAAITALAVCSKRRSSADHDASSAVWVASDRSSYGKVSQEQADDGSSTMMLNAKDFSAM